MLKKMNFTYLILLLTITLFSCQKEELPRPENDNSVSPNTGSVEGVTWVLSEGRVYLENLDNGDKTVYDYFGGGVNEAYLHILGGYTGVMMDSVKKDYTTWFFNNGLFTLNGQHSSEYNEYMGSYSVYGLTGGTARPIEPVVINNTMVVSLHEAYGSHNGTNYEYVSELTFVKAGTSCNNCQPSVEYGWVYNGVWDVISEPQNTMVGTKWVISRYNNGLSGNVYPNDTLDFITDLDYTINGGLPRVYTLNNVIGNNMKSLSLYGCSTLGGDYGGEVLGTFIEDGIIQNSRFTNLFNTGNTITVWMERIQ